MKRFIIPCFSVILMLILIFVTQSTSNPKRCAICDSIPYHAPCLVNLKTGEVGELAVYEPHPFKSGELNEYQQGGTFSFMNIAGATGYRDGMNYELQITIPANENEYGEKFFCASCRKLISGHTEYGFLLIDLKIPDNPVPLSLVPDSRQSVRCYEIQVWENANGIEIVVQGTLDIIDHHISE